MPPPVARREVAPASAPARPSPPTARQVSPTIRTRTPTSWAVLLTIAVCFVSHVLAAAASPRALVPDYRQPFGGGGRWAPLQVEQKGRPVEKRADDTESSSSSESSKPTSTSSGSSSTSASVTTTFSLGATSTGRASPSTTAASANPLPSILDSLFSDFTPDPNGGEPPCQKFIKSFLNDPTFQQCYPLSMLLDLSQSFFEAQRSMVSITRTLDATCAANPATCNEYLSLLADDLLLAENCGAEFDRGLQIVLDTYKTLRAYAPVYAAGCLRDPDTGAYCYAKAVTNVSNPSGTYVYYLPLNRTLPGTTVPECNYCLKQTMALYQAATADRRQYIANTYMDAAKQVNTICGRGFTNETLADVVVPSAAAVPAMGALLLWMVAAAAGWAAVM
ncbi:hypothetical protein VTJ83DRAFT_2484 [Remersonia thermophila]|uniref:DUF7729 domain-containing protein n=1 Tax=Remersonia thermophila TaxID=72144 RepID=A0ABR4DJH2_9PEZI